MVGLTVFCQMTFAHGMLDPIRKMLACRDHIERVSDGGPLKIGEYIVDCAPSLRHEQLGENLALQWAKS